MYQLRFSRGPHNLFLDFYLLNLYKHLVNLKKDYEDLCWPLIDKYKLILYNTSPIFSEIEVSQ